MFPFPPVEVFSADYSAALAYMFSLPQRGMYIPCHGTYIPFYGTYVPKDGTKNSSAKNDN
jgi:hypothetical protein